MKEERLRTDGQAINVRIGNRVRALRMERGLSLDALAARSDVSRSMISVVERGESSATAVVLEKIATGLGVMLASLFDDMQAPHSPISRGDERTTWSDPQSGYLRRNISPPNFPSPLRIVEVVLPAGARVAYETGPRETTIHQQIWVQEGSIEVTLGGAAYQLAADDCVAMQLDDAMVFFNPTDAPARYLVIISIDRSHPSRSYHAGEY